MVARRETGPSDDTVIQSRWEGGDDISEHLPASWPARSSALEPLPLDGNGSLPGSVALAGDHRNIIFGSCSRQLQT